MPPDTSRSEIICDRCDTRAPDPSSSSAATRLGTCLPTFRSGSRHAPGRARRRLSDERRTCRADEGTATGSEWRDVRPGARSTQTGSRSSTRPPVRPRMRQICGALGIRTHGSRRAVNAFSPCSTNLDHYLPLCAKCHAAFDSKGYKLDRVCALCSSTFRRLASAMYCSDVCRKQAAEQRAAKRKQRTQKRQRATV